MTYIRETVVEKYLKQQVETVLDGICEKHVSPGRRGPPDRLITLHGGIMDLAETKAPKGKLTAWQKRDHALRTRRGVKVFTLYTKDDVDRYIKFRALLSLI